MPYRTDANTTAVAVAPQDEARFRIAPYWVARVWQFSSVMMVIVLTVLACVASALGSRESAAYAWTLGAFATIGWAAYQRRATRGLVRLQNEAVQMLARGDVEAAGARLDALALRSRAVPSLHVLVAVNRGVVALRRGEASRAIALMTPALSSRWATSVALKVAFPGLAASLALAHAYQANLPAARQWQEAARARLTAAQTGVLALGDAVLALRSGRPQDASAVLASQWNNAEAVVGARQMRLLRILRAFALGDAPEHADEARRLLEGARPSEPGEFDYVAGHWPELQAFLARNGFSRS